jgi:hypothetical protein
MLGDERSMCVLLLKGPVGQRLPVLRLRVGPDVWRSWGYGHSTNRLSGLPNHELRRLVGEAVARLQTTLRHHAKAVGQLTALVLAAGEETGERRIDGLATAWLSGRQIGSDKSKTRASSSHA